MAPASPIVSGTTAETAALTREERELALGYRGATLWFTGLPAAGKSTLASALERALVSRGRPAYRLDGDVLRHGLNRDLSFSAQDRDENVRRTGHAASLLADAGVVALVALVSPYRAARDNARRLHAAAGLPFAEVFVDTPVDLCEARDRKGLYHRAKRGQLPGLTGVDAPYERPLAPERVIAPAPLDDCLRIVLALVNSMVG